MAFWVTPQLLCCSDIPDKINKRNTLTAENDYKKKNDNDVIIKPRQMWKHTYTH